MRESLRGTASPGFADRLHAGADSAAFPCHRSAHGSKSAGRAIYSGRLQLFGIALYGLEHDLVRKVCNFSGSSSIESRPRVGHVCAPLEDVHADAVAIGAGPGGGHVEPVAGRGMPRPDRRPGRRGPPRLPQGPCRDGARQRRLRRPSARPRSRAVAVRRHPGLDQGPVRYRRRRDHLGLSRAARRRARDGGRGRGGAAAGRRPDPDRPHQHDRVRLLRPRHQPALRHAAQSV